MGQGGAPSSRIWPMGEQRPAQRPPFLGVRELGGGAAQTGGGPGPAGGSGRKARADPSPAPAQISHPNSHFSPGTAMEHVTLLLFLTLFFLCQAQGPPACQEQAMSAGGTLELLPGKPLQGWAKLEWRLMLEGGIYQRILTADKSNVTLPSKSSYAGRAEFQRDSLSLRISRVSMADSGVYQVDFEDASGDVTHQCFRVSVWELIQQPCLEPRILPWEQGWCNLSLLCTVPGPGNFSYRWSCTGDALEVLEQQPRLHLQVRRDAADPTVCRCNASNPVSWSAASTDVTAACRAAASGFSWSYHKVKALLCLLVLGSLVTAVVITHVLIRQRGPPSHAPPSSSGRWVGPPTGEPAEQPPALAPLCASGQASAHPKK